MLKRLLNLFSPSIKVISKLSPFMSSSKKIDQNRIVTSLFVGSDEHAVAKMVLTFAGTVVFHLASRYQSVSSSVFLQWLTKWKRSQHLDQTLTWQLQKCLEIEKKEEETQDLYLCVLKWMNLKQESSDVDKIFFKCPIVTMTSFNSPNRDRLMLKV